MGGVLSVVGKLSLSFLLRPTKNWRDECQDFDAGRVAPELRPRQLSELGNVLGANGGGVCGDEDGFSVLRGKLLTGARCARLEKKRRSLRARLAEVRSGHVEESAIVVDLPNQVRLRVYPRLAVELHSVVAPRRLQEFVDHFNVFLRLRVSVVVLFSGE